MAQAEPERAPSGAITRMSPKGDNISINSFNPFACTPSSFESRISGLMSFIFTYICFYKSTKKGLKAQCFH